MGYLPIMVDLSGQPCVIIGGGAVAEAKLGALFEAGALVTLISPSINAGIRHALKCDKLRYIAREYVRGDLRGYRLAFVAAGDEEVARRVAAEALELGIPINAVDRPGLSRFISPAIVRRGDLQIAISTGGASPAVARMLRRQLERQIGTEYVLLTEIMRLARRYLRAQPGLDYHARARILNALAPKLLEAIEALDDDAIEAVLRSYLGAGMAELGYPDAAGAGRPPREA
ncbi:MAG TPA: bifunctional precorrin-2 dehydrogenase/sirohydrochlorin ferrochelatase [Candidatus Binataceae bacterium]|nr:bifunctional precorrin-2 dehydrogenase/sirohydrochlorin ferrochelatase [Candidatus Binataceae bacterium]